MTSCYGIIYIVLLNIILCAKFGCTMLKYYINVRWWKFIKITAVITTCSYQYFTSLILLYYFFLPLSFITGDVIRADAKDIPRIFQILYANEAERINPVEKEKEEQQPEDRMNAIDYMRHQFIPMHYHMPTNCDSCNKPLWHMFKPPPAVECKRCHMKCHKDHVDREEACITMCNVNMEMISAKELLVLAQTADEQKQWVVYLSKKIIRKEPKIKSPSVRLSVEEANARRSMAERSGGRPSGPQRSVSMSVGQNRKITWFSPVVTLWSITIEAFGSGAINVRSQSKLRGNKQNCDKQSFVLDKWQSGIPVRISAQDIELWDSGMFLPRSRLSE